jgi:hypothetical protein
MPLQLSKVDLIMGLVKSNWKIGNRKKEEDANKLIKEAPI